MRPSGWNSPGWLRRPAEQRGGCVRPDDLLDRVPPPLPLFAPPPDWTEKDLGPVLLARPPFHASSEDAAEDGAEPFLATTPWSRVALEPLPTEAPGTAVAEREKPIESVRRKLSPLNLAASIALHLLPLVLLIAWPIPPPEFTPAIPVQLVVEQPKPAPAPLPPPPAREKKRPSGRLASENMGNPDVKQRQAGSEPEAAAPKQREPQEAPTRMVSALPPPTPNAMPLPEATDQAAQEQQAVLPPPQPAAPVSRRRAPTPPRPPPHLGFPGPAASRDEYLAYCAELIGRHFDMLPPSFIGGRRGLTVLSLLVLDDGRIARVAVVRSSGYHDIDERIERMVAAVGRFPPLPQWFQGEEMPLEYELPFPAGLVRR